MNATAPPLTPDLVEGLRRLKLAAMRQLAPELLRTAKTQRWAPEELLRTLVEAEIAARDASNARTRLKTATFPVVKTGVPPTFRIADPIRSRSKWRNIDAGEAPEIHSGVQVRSGSSCSRHLASYRRGCPRDRCT